ncbi:MAG: formyltransferase family protein [Chitinophagaceae bacterium]
MTKEGKRILIWCGNASNQRALANKIANQFHLCGIVVDYKTNQKKIPFIKRAIAAAQDRFFFRTLHDSWSSLQQKYSRQYPQWPDVPKLDAASINSGEAFDFSKNLAPDLVVVSGTSLIKEAMLALSPGIGIINLHTGLSPYIKGGPNCTNWCISTAQYEKIGNTIMWINQGIDAGNIITSEVTLLKDVKNLAEIQWQVMEHAHELYQQAIEYLLNTTGPYNSIPQKEIANGTLYLTKMWNYTAKKKLLGNLPAFLKNRWAKSGETIITVPIKQNMNER